jgi:hypothetical protein
MKLNITLDNKGDYDLLCEALVAYREHVIFQSQRDELTPAENALLVDKAIRLESLFRKVTF